MSDFLAPFFIGINLSLDDADSEYIYYNGCNIKNVAFLFCL